MITAAIHAIAFVLTAPTTVSASDGFLSSGEVGKEDVKDKLLAELAARGRLGDDGSRIAQLEAELRSMYVAAPKNTENRLDHSVVRYALHRLLVQRHGWFIKGLEPDGGARNSSSSHELQEWVPSYLQDFLEHRSQGHGLDLQELVALAATLEDLVHDEAVERLSFVYKVLDLPKNREIGGEDLENVIDLYLMVYLVGGKLEVGTAHDALMALGRFKKKYTGWREVEAWARDVQKNATSNAERVDFAASAFVAEAIGLQFGTFNDVECRDLKSTLLRIEDQKQGRVRLADFYRMGLHTHWAFTEKVDYLRALGALDESDPARPSVIVANYLGSRPQCLEASHFYAVCCRNECEDLMGSLERAIAEPFASAQRVAELVSALSSDTVPALRQLAGALLSRLDQIASAHDGKVPLHSRLFAQWMHHAFPRECPFPHEAGTINPQTPDEWIRSTGQESTQASEDEMVCYVSGSCSGAEGSATPADVDAPVDLPWSDAEELLVGLPRGQADESLIEAYAEAVNSLGASAWIRALQSFNVGLRGLILVAVVLGLALASKVAVPTAESPVKMTLEGKASWLVTLMLFLVPLLAVSIDFAIDFASGNEILICGMSWAVAGMVILRFQVNRGETAKQLLQSLWQPKGSQLTECFV